MRRCLLAALLSCAGCGASVTPIPSRPAVLLAAAQPPSIDVSPRPRIVRVEPRLVVGDQAAARIASAREMSARFEHPGALEAVNAAQVLLEGAARTRRDWDLLHEALVLRGTLELELGRSDDAREAMRVAARLRPEAELDPVRFPPDAIALYAAVAAEAREARRASLTVTTEPPGAHVLLDGEPAGVGPITVHASPGQHYVRVDALGYEGRVLPVRIDANGNAPLTVDLPRAQPDEVARQVAALAESEVVALEGRELATVGERLDAGVLLRYDDQRERLLAVAIPEGIARVRPARGSSLTSTLDDMEEERVGPPPVPAWVWIGGAIVLALTAGAAIYYYAIYEPTPVVQVTRER